MRKFAFPYPLLLLAIWSGMLLTGDYVVLDTSVRQVLATRFDTTVGHVIKSDMGHGRLSRRGVEIGYSYTVNGMDYTGLRYRYDDRNGAFDYSAVTNALPRGSRQKVYYDPAEPADSVLVPGLNGCDLLLALFALPLNIVTGSIWISILRNRRDADRRAAAGGVRILQDEGETRARLTEFSPLAAGSFGLAGAAFGAAMLVVFAAGFRPSLELMAGVWILVATVGLAAFLWTAQRQYFGRSDLRSSKASNTLLVPPAGGRKELLLVPRREIVAVSLHRRVSNSPSGQYFSYVPALDHASSSSAPQSLELINWGWQERKARAFADWLSQELGVPFKGNE